MGKQRAHLPCNRPSRPKSLLPSLLNFFLLLHHHDPPSHGAPVRRQDGKGNRRPIAPIVVLVETRKPRHHPSSKGPSQRGDLARTYPRPRTQRDQLPATAAASRTRRRPSTADACRNTCPAAPGATRNVGRTSGEDQRAHCPSDTNKLRILCPHGDELGSGLCRLTARSGPTVRKGSYITPFPYRPVRFHACLVRPAPVVKWSILYAHAPLRGKRGREEKRPQLHSARGVCFWGSRQQGKEEKDKVVGVLCKEERETRGSEGGISKCRTSPLTLFAIDSRSPSAPTDDQDNRRREEETDNRQHQRHHVCCGSILAGPRRVRLGPLGPRAAAAAASKTTVVVEGPHRTHGRFRRGTAVDDDTTTPRALL